MCGRRKETVTLYQHPRNTKTAQYWSWPPATDDAAPLHPQEVMTTVLTVISASVSAVVYTRITNTRIGSYRCSKSIQGPERHFTTFLTPSITCIHNVNSHMDKSRNPITFHSKLWPFPRQSLIRDFNEAKIV